MRVPVNIGRSGIVAGLQGVGSIVSGLQAINLDGSSSYDPNNRNSVLDYTWICTDADGNDCVKQNGDTLIFENAAKFVVPAQSLASSLEGIAYTFTLIVASALGGRSSQASVKTLLVSIAVPDVSIVSPFRQSLLRCSDQLVLVASSTSNQSSAFSYEWYEATGRLSAAQLAASADPLLKTSSRSFIILPNKLTPGTRYTFRVNVVLVTALGNQSGYSEFDVEVNSPPSGGSCTVCVSGGGCSALSLAGSTDDTFTPQCTGWSDQHTPISFQFGYGSILQGPFTTPSYSLTLPGGLQRVFAVICDVFGSCTDPFVFNVNVSSVPIVPDAVNQMLDNLAFSGDVSSLLLYAASKSQDVSAQSNKSLSGRR